MSTNEENISNEVDNTSESNEMKELLCETLERIKYLDSKINTLLDDMQDVKRDLYYIR